jgi:hypothetical protein
MNHKEFKGYTFANNSYKVRAMVDWKKLHFGAYHDEETAKEIYLLIKKLWIEDRLTGIQIKKIIQEKYFHKKSRYIETKGYRLIKGKYVTRATINGQRKHIGTFKTPEEAHAAYLKAKEEYKKWI